MTSESKPLTPALRRALADSVGAEGVITDPDQLLVYESDGLTQYRFPPSAVVFPRTTQEVSEVVRHLAEAGRAFVARGAGTGLSGGALAVDGAVLVATTRMNRILELDPENRRARVQPGVINAELTRAAAPHGLYYAPDPSSQSACTLGGNVAENSGGPHCLKYGVTSRYVTGLTVVLPDGETVRLGGMDHDAEGLDLVGLFVGSEGCFGIATEIEVALLPAPEGVRTLLATFASLEEAGAAVTEIMARGLLPAALEIVDGATIRAVEESIFAAGYPIDAEAALVVEFDGVDAGLDEEVELAREICAGAGATGVRSASDEAERSALWAGRKKAFGAMGRIAPDLLVQDATVPRTRLPEVLARIGEIGERYRLKVANVFHAGDGNLHPNLLFDRSDPDELARVERASREIMAVCIEAGGTITGEHGVGIDKRAYMTLVHDEPVLRAMGAVKAAFDPAGLANPGKVLPDGYGPGAAGKQVPPDSRRAHSAGSPRASTLPVATENPSHEFEHEPADLSVAVGGGMELGELARRLEEAGQWLPLDPAGGDRMTVGELVAEGAGGPLRLGFGLPRDHVLGLTLVDGTGRALRLGGRVVKNVAGFDLVRLAVGSRGTLGVIASATLRVFPLPRSERVLEWEAAGVEEGWRLARDLLALPIPFAALELIGDGSSVRVVARVAGSGLETEWCGERLRESAGTPAEERTGSAATARFREHFAEEGRRPICLRARSLPGDGDRLLRALASSEESLGASSWALGVGYGGLRAGWPSSEAMRGADEEAWAEAVAPLRAAAAELGGSVRLRVREDGDQAGEGRKAGWEARWGPPVDPGVARLQRRLLEVFDPEGVLPGGWMEGRR